MQTGKRIWSLVLVTAMILSVFSGMPITAFAEGELDSIPLGTSTSISITSADHYACPTGEGGTFQVTAEGAENIGFAVDGEPEGVSIDADTGLLAVADTIEAGEYKFDIIASDADGEAAEAVQSFALTVAARKDAVIVAAFEELPDEVRYQGYDYKEIESADALTLPAKLAGTNADGNTIEIEGVTWVSDPAFDSAVSIAYPGYVFTAVLPEGYIPAEGVAAPVITVFIRPEGGVGIVPLAGTPANIDISLLGGTDMMSPVGEDLWTYSGSSKTLSLVGDGGNFTLSGTNNNLRVYVQAGTVSTGITFNGVTITPPDADYAFDTRNDCTVTLVGTNTLNGDSVFNVGAGKSCTISGGGNLTMTASIGSGLVLGGTLEITGTASVTVVGGPGRVAIIGPSAILMGDNGTLTMINNSASNETHTFEKSNAASTHQWKLTNATTTGNLTDATIPVTVPAGQTGTVAREASSPPSASVADVTISGVVGTALIAPTANITLTNVRIGAVAYFADATSWFSNLPAGVTAFGSGAVNGDTIVVTFNGTPTAISSAALEITIPAGILAGGAALAVTPNPNATFSIVSPNPGTIDVGTLGGSDGANQPGEDAWTYTASSKILDLSEPGGNYTLTGTNNNLSVIIRGDGASITLSGVDITGQGVFGIQNNCTMTLVGANTLTGTNNGNAISINAPNCTLTINGGGSLTAATTSGNGYGISIAQDSNLNIAGTADVSVDAAGNDGIFCSGHGGNTISVDSGASLSVTGNYDGISVNAGNLTLNSSGMITTTCRQYSGVSFGAIRIMEAGATLILGGSGTVEAIGAAGGIAIVTSGPIRMGDDTTLTMANRHATNNETHTFESSNTAYKWKLTDDATTTGNLTDVSIPVTVAAGQTGTVAREAKPATTYAVTVINDTGSNSYAQGATVTITANAAPAGQRFKQWNIAPSVTFKDDTDATSATAKFTMPAQAVTATAVYEPIPATTYAVTVINGTGSNSYAQGATVTITANAAPAGQQFKQWNITPSVTFTDGTSATSATAKFIMPAQAVTATAVYEPIPATTYAVTVINGMGSNSYAQGATVTITANAAPAGQRFKEWSITPAVTFTGDTSATSSTAKFTMPAQAVTATATYEPLPANYYSITVLNDGNGLANANVNSAQQGDPITLTATPNSSYRFKEWQVISGGVSIVNNQFTMPAANVVVKAIFEPIPAATYSVAVNGSYAGTTGAGSYAQGTTVTIHAGSRSSYTFNGWSSADGVTFANSRSATTTFTMPAKNVTVSASWTYIGGTSNDSSSSGGGGGGGSVTITDGAVPLASAPSTTWLEQNPAGTVASEANSQNQGYVRTSSSGAYGVRGASWAKFTGLKYEHDTVADGAVQVRLYISNPEKLTKDAMVSGYVEGSAVDNAKGIFEKWFKNKVRVVHLDQQGDWGQPVRIAAKIDPTGMDTKKLYFYSYDKAANSYKRIEKPAYWIDKNGYLHFTTEYAGDIIICEGPLEKK